MHGGIFPRTDLPIPRIEEINNYADSEMYLVELTIFLSPHDLCELKNQPFYQELIQYLDSLRIQRNGELPKEVSSSKVKVESE